MEPAEPHPARCTASCAQIVAAEDLFEGSHDHKLAVELFESFPKEELFAADWQDLRRSVVSLLEPPGAGERAAVRARRPRGAHRLPRRRPAARPLQRRAAPRPRQALPGALQRRLGRLPPVARRVRRRRASTSRCTCAATLPDVSLPELEQEVAALTRTWDDRLRGAARGAARRGARAGARPRSTRARLPGYYKQSSDISAAVLDIEAFERIDAGEPFVVALQNERGSAGSLTRVGFYKTGGKVQLSDFLPILEALGLRGRRGGADAAGRRRRRDVPARLRRARARRHDARPRRLRRARRRVHRAPSGAARPSPTRSTGWSSRPG